MDDILNMNSITMYCLMIHNVIEHEYDYWIVLLNSISFVINVQNGNYTHIWAYIEIIVLSSDHTKYHPSGYLYYVDWGKGFKIHQPIKVKMVHFRIITLFFTILQTSGGELP